MKNCSNILRGDPDVYRGRLRGSKRAIYHEVLEGQEGFRGQYTEPRNTPNTRKGLFTILDQVRDRYRAGWVILNNERYKGKIHTLKRLKDVE